MRADSSHRLARPLARSLARLAELERRYDGPLPADELSDELSDESESRLCRIKGLLALHQTLAAAARAGAAARRRGLTVAGVPADSWLSRLTLTLAGHRTAAVAMLEPGWRN